MKYHTAKFKLRMLRSNILGLYPKCLGGESVKTTRSIDKIDVLKTEILTWNLLQTNQNRHPMKQISRALY